MGKLTHWAVIFSVIGLFAAFLGFGELAGPATPLAKGVFWFSLGAVAISLMGCIVRQA